MFALKIKLTLSLYYFDFGSLGRIDTSWCHLARIKSNGLFVFCLALLQEKQGVKFVKARFSVSNCIVFNVQLVILLIILFFSDETKYNVKNLV